MSGKSYNCEHTKGVFNTPWFSIEEIPSVSPTEEPYYSISCPDSVAILAQTLDGEFILVRQYGINAKLENKHNNDSDIEIVLAPVDSYEKYISDGTYNETIGIVAYFMSKGRFFP